jgi:hypothetical protein
MRRLLIVGVLAVVVCSGALSLYYYSAPIQFFGTGTQSSGSSTYLGSTVSSSGVTAAGYQQNYDPVGTWANYLGYLPSGYNAAAHLINAPTYPCPAGMSEGACQSFRQTCGNGVCDPNESCSSCAIDCASPGALTCDPYTGRTGSPVSVCQLGQNGG